MGIRDMMKALSPTWAKDGDFERFLYSMGLAKDAVIDKLVQGVEASLATKTQTATTLAYIALDSLMARGLTEGDASFIARLQRAYDDWQLAGGDWMVLRQVLGLVLSTTPAARTVKDIYTSAGALSRSVWYSYAASADTTKAPGRAVLTGGAANWDWDSLSPTNGSWGRWRYWLVLYATGGNQFATAAPTWGSTTWGQTTNSWGLSQPPSFAQLLRSVVGLWQRGGSWCHEMIVSFDDTLFDPAQPVGGAFNPDGNFGRASKVVAGQYVPSRFANARYIQGVY